MNFLVVMGGKAKVVDGSLYQVRMSAVPPMGCEAATFTTTIRSFSDRKRALAFAYKVASNFFQLPESVCVVRLFAAPTHAIPKYIDPELITGKLSLRFATFRICSDDGHNHVVIFWENTIQCNLFSTTLKPFMQCVEPRGDVSLDVAIEVVQEVMGVWEKMHGKKNKLNG